MEINTNTNTPWFPFSAAKKKVNEFSRDPPVFGSNFQFHDSGNLIIISGTFRVALGGGGVFDDPAAAALTTNTK